MKGTAANMSLFQFLDLFLDQYLFGQDADGVCWQQPADGEAVVRDLPVADVPQGY